MKSIKTILFTLAAFAAGIPATRADETSALVAAVAASMETQQRMQADMLRAVLGVPTDTIADPRPRYTPAPDITISLLDGILQSMEMQGRHTRTAHADGGRLPHAGTAHTDGSFGQYARPEVAYHMHGQYARAEAAFNLMEFFRPVPGPITSRFGWRPLFQRVHHGVDIALQVGDTVRCAVSGTVEHIAYDHDGYGHYVLLSHPDGMETLYGHLLYPLVAQGEMIYAGQPVGIGGDTGNSTGPHLHFEARLGGVAVDPLLLFDFYGINRYLYATEETFSEGSSRKAPTYTHQQTSLKEESTYIVRAGDTPESVARQAGISVMRLLQLNMLSATEPLPLGRMLKLK